MFKRCAQSIVKRNLQQALVLSDHVEGYENEAKQTADELSNQIRQGIVQHKL